MSKVKGAAEVGDPLPSQDPQLARAWPEGGASVRNDAGGGAGSTAALVRRRRRRHATVAAVLVASGAVVGATFHQHLSPVLSATTAGSASDPAAAYAPIASPAVPAQPPVAPGDTASSGGVGSANVAGIAAKVNPALVDINVTLSYQRAQAAGTGVVLTSTGEVLTNNHVISGATALSVTDVGNGRTYDATVVGYDVANDLAVLQLRNASGLHAAAIGDSSKVAVGQSVVAVGNAGGLGGVPSSAGGTITALGQSITASSDSGGASEQLAGLIQINANIQPGDSGGALVNSAGQVIGINTAASAGRSFRSAGPQAFAIPINAAQLTARQIVAGRGVGTVHVGATPFLGVLITSTAGQPGATLAGVVPGGPAEKAGLAGGDVITSLGGQRVDSAATLSRLVGQERPGGTIAIGWTDAAGLVQVGALTVATGPPA